MTKMPLSRSSKDKDTKKPRVLASRYEIIKKLGTGNFGAAFLCADNKNKSNEKKVLKEISVGDLQPDETLDAMHEAKLLSKLNHPCIVMFHDSFIDGEYFCIVTEYCEGGDLDCKIIQYRKNNKKFTEKNVMDWFVQLILAIHYLHSRKVLHRDLKTRNIFLKRNMIKIGDFGISRILMGTADLASTFTGTPYYMSPEVLKHEGYNSKSDIWAVGCILYELCALDHAFNGQSLMAVMYKIVEGNIPDLPEPYSKNMNELFKLMLSKDLDVRPSATEILKQPFINNYITKMKDSVIFDMRSKQTRDDGSAERESKEIMETLQEKSHIGELQRPEEDIRTEEDIKLQNLPPRERMRLKKIQLANAREEKLKEAAKINLAENQHRKAAIQGALSKTSLPAWQGGTGEGTVVQDALKRASTTALTHGADDDRERTLTSYRRRGSDTLSKTAPNPIRINYEDEFRQNSSLSRTSSNSQYSYDERPLTPLKDKMVYNRDASSLDFEDGIPDKPDLAETYYDQFNDFEKDRDSYSSEDDSDEASGTVVHRTQWRDNSDSDDEIANTVIHRSVSDNTLLTNTIEAAENTGEFDAFIDCLQVALEKPEQGGTIIVEDDVQGGGFGPAVREQKIKSLKVDCIKMLGAECFNNAYEYLKNARYSGDSDKTEENIIEGLRKCVPNPSDCFLVDQLLFLEEQAGYIEAFR